MTGTAAAGPKGLYVHVPFCVRKCAYCDFYSLPGTAHPIQAYVAAVIAEARGWQGLEAGTLYVGGGTPSLLGAEGLATLLSSLRETLSLLTLCEATMEVNPESASPALLQTARRQGIDRISVGVQSLSDAELAGVGRIHTSAQAEAAVTQAVAMGFAVSADAIAGLPGQDWPSLRRTLERLIALGAEHISLYCLELATGTPLAVHPPADLPSDDSQADLFEAACDLLASAGFMHYEVSNFSLPGRQCRHNLNYWRGGEYLGLGPAAASHLAGRRWRNKPDLRSYLRAPGSQREDIELLPPAQKAAEEAMLRLRLLLEGLPPQGLAERFGPENVAALLERLEALRRQRLLSFDGTAYRLPPQRVLTSNPILAAIV